MVLALYKKSLRPFHYDREKRIPSVQFKRFKFNNRIVPSNKSRVAVVGCFSEFGCETVGVLYCLPRLVRKLAGKYIIGVGWYGREYFYRHLLDEFWEIDPSAMCLRTYAKAFHNSSINLSRIENSFLEITDTLIKSESLGAYVVLNTCLTCGLMWADRRADNRCALCKNTLIQRGIYDEIISSKKTVTPIPRPKGQTLDWASKIVSKPTVGIFARNRATYGRNLTKDFYLDLIKLVKNKGYEVIWLGEKESTYPCPDPTVFDFSRTYESRDLEKTLAIITCLSFTVQFFTASSRLSGMMGVPYLIVESPDQIFNPGQEGLRLELTTFGKKKLLLSNFEFLKANEKEGLIYVERAIDEMIKGDYQELIGLVSDKKKCLEQLNEFRDNLRLQQ